MARNTTESEFATVSPETPSERPARFLPVSQLKDELIQVFRKTGKNELKLPNIKTAYYNEFGRKLDGTLVGKYGLESVPTAFKKMSDVFTVGEGAPNTRRMRKMSVKFRDPKGVQVRETPGKAKDASDSKALHSGSHVGGNLLEVLSQMTTNSPALLASSPSPPLQPTPSPATAVDMAQNQAANQSRGSANGHTVNQGISPLFPPPPNPPEMAKNTVGGYSSAPSQVPAECLPVGQLREDLICVFRTTGKNELKVSRMKSEYLNIFGKKLDSNLTVKYGINVNLPSALRLMSDVFVVDEKAQNPSKMLVKFRDPVLHPIPPEPFGSRSLQSGLMNHAQVQVGIVNQGISPILPLPPPAVFPTQLVQGSLPGPPIFPAEFGTSPQSFGNFQSLYAVRPHWEQPQQQLLEQQHQQQQIQQLLLLQQQQQQIQQQQGKGTCADTPKHSSQSFGGESEKKEETTKNVGELESADNSGDGLLASSQLPTNNASRPSSPSPALQPTPSPATAVDVAQNQIETQSGASASGLTVNQGVSPIFPLPPPAVFPTQLAQSPLAGPPILPPEFGGSPRTFGNFQGVYPVRPHWQQHQQQLLLEQQHQQQQIQHLLLLQQQQIQQQQGKGTGADTPKHSSQSVGGESEKEEKTTNVGELESADHSGDGLLASSQLATNNASRASSPRPALPPAPSPATTVDVAQSQTATQSGASGHPVNQGISPILPLPPPAVFPTQLAQGSLPGPRMLPLGFGNFQTLHTVRPCWPQHQQLLLEQQHQQQQLLLLQQQQIQKQQGAVTGADIPEHSTVAVGGRSGKDEEPAKKGGELESADRSGEGLLASSQPATNDNASSGSSPTTLQPAPDSAAESKKQAAIPTAASASGNLEQGISPLLPLPATAVCPRQSDSLAAPHGWAFRLDTSLTAVQPTPFRDIQEQQQQQLPQRQGQGEKTGLSTSSESATDPGKAEKAPRNVRKLDDGDGATGKPGPFEEAFSKAQQHAASPISLGAKKKRPTPQEMNRFVQNQIDELSEDGQYVSKELIVANLRRHFGVSSIKDVGLRKDTDIPAINDLVKLQNKVEMFFHAYVMVHSVSTLHEIGQSLANLEEKMDFFDLKLGPLAKQPAAYKLFKFPHENQVPPITTIQILQHLRTYMRKEDLWTKKVQLQKFIEYLCPLYNCQTPFDLGLRFGGLGLSISVIKKASGTQSKTMDKVREQLEDDMEKDIRKRLNKIKTDLLGQHVGDLRSMVETLLNASPSDIITKVFDHCHELFTGMQQKIVNKFLELLVKNRLARDLFQLAVHRGCKSIIGPTAPDTGPNMTQDGGQQEEEKAVQPPPKRDVVSAAKKWLQKMDALDLSHLARVESMLLGHFPGFPTFESLGCGPFLEFVTQNKELDATLQQFGAGALSAHSGTSPKVTLSHVVDFIAQCGVKSEQADIAQSLCAHYSVREVGDLGVGTFDRLLNKAKDQQQERKGRNIFYESAFLCASGSPPSRCTSSKTGSGRSCGVLGSQDKERALEAIASTPLLGDVACWTQWQDVFRPEHGDLKDFLVKEGMLSGRRDATSPATREERAEVVVLETQPGVLLRVTRDTSEEHLQKWAEAEDAFGCAGHLVSLVIDNGGIEDTPLALLANHLKSALQTLNSRSSEGTRRCLEFVLQCLTRMPSGFCVALAHKMFLRPLEEITGSADMPSLLLSCCQTETQRSRLHMLGFCLGVTAWEKDFQERTSTASLCRDVCQSGKELAREKPLAIVRPTPSSSSPPKENEEAVGRPSHTREHREQSDESEIEQGDLRTDDETGSRMDSSGRSADGDEDETCKALIESIRRDEFGIEAELGEKEEQIAQRQREREGRALARLSTELYSRDTHFVLELVQNADDNSYPPGCSPTLEFILEPDTITVLNNESGFTEAHIRALCDVGKSTKGQHRYGYIGQKGIGFKSVFRITDRPEVHSNGYHICFDAKSGPVGLILPQWIGEKTPSEQCSEIHLQTDGEEWANDEASNRPSGNGDLSGWMTRIVLPLKQDFQRGTHSCLAARFRELHPSLLLFLHRLKRISVINKVDNTSEHMARTDLGNNVMQVSHTKGTDRWLVVKKKLDASEMKDDVQMTELALAFPLPVDEQGRIKTANPKAFANHQNVFAYLPLRSYGFRFIVQGDFEVPSSREDVDSDKMWNQWLRGEIPQLFLDALDVFRNHQLFPGLSSISAYLRFVPLEEEIQNFFAPVARRILKLLQGTPCIPVEAVSQGSHVQSSGTAEAECKDTPSENVDWVQACKAVRCSADPKVVKRLLPPVSLKRHLGLYYLHPDVASAINPALSVKLGIEELSSSHLIDIGKTASKALATISSNRDLQSDFFESGFSTLEWVANWLCQLCRCRNREHESGHEILDQIASLSIIPLTDGSFVKLKADPVFFPLLPDRNNRATKSASPCTTILQEDLRTLHPELLNSLDDVGRSEVKQLLRQLGLKSWSASEIIDSHILPTLSSEKWKDKAKDTIRSYLVYVQEQWCANPSVCDLGELRKCAKVLTNKDTKVNPMQVPVYFTTRYGNPIDLRGKIPSVSWTLLDESYLDRSATPAAVARWQKFFTELGVRNFLAIERKEISVHRRESSAWTSSVEEWPSTPDGAYVIFDWSCSELEEFLNKPVNPEEAQVLAKCLDERWDKEYSKYAQCNVPVKDTDGNALLQTFSSFYLNLVSKPWIPATKKGGGREHLAIRVPRDLYLHTEETYSLLHNHVSYTDLKFQSSMFIEALKLKTKVGFKGMLDELSSWAVTSRGDGAREDQKTFTTSLGHMKRVYSFLHKHCALSQDQRREHICDAFNKQPLLFIPQTKLGHKFGDVFSGVFCFKKDVCLEDPTGVVVTLEQQEETAIKRHLIGHFYLQDPYVTKFFVEVLNIDKTPNIGEYVGVASALAERSKVPTPEVVDKIRKVFAELGKKCTTQPPSGRMTPDSIDMNRGPEEAQIDPVKSGYLKERLKGEDVFPTTDKWISLEESPVLPDEKHLLKIFEKVPNVSLLDLGDRSDLRNTPMRSRKPDHRALQQQTLLRAFLKACGISSLSDSIDKNIIPTLVKTPCIPLQKYFFTVVPCIQRFIYYQIDELYDKVQSRQIPDKLRNMTFATAEKLETVYSLKGRPDVIVPVQRKFGVDEVGSSHWFYAVEEHAKNLDEVNVEIVNLFTLERREHTALIRNFLSALQSVIQKKGDIEKFLRDDQELDPMPTGVEEWYVPAPPAEVPEERVAPEEDLPINLPERAQPEKREGGELYCWPPRSSAFQRKGAAPASAAVEETLKQWPLPAAPPEACATPEKQSQSGTWAPKPEQAASGLNGSEHTQAREEVGLGAAATPISRAASGISRAHMPQVVAHPAPQGSPERAPHSPEPAPRQMSEDEQPNQSAKAPISAVAQNSAGGGGTMAVGVGVLDAVRSPVAPQEVRDIPAAQNFSVFVCAEEDIKQEFEELPFDRHLPIPEVFPEGSHPNKDEIGRWGEMFVMRFLESHQKAFGEGVQIIWVNEEHNTSAPYDFQITRQVSDGGEERAITTYVEVKTTSSSDKEVFEISSRELKFALEKREAFHLYRVFNAGKPGHVRLARLQDLAANLDKKTVQLLMVV